MSSARSIQAREAQAQRLYAVTKPTNLTPPVTYVNATTTGPLVQKPMSSPRDGANDHLLIQSLGMRPQIKRSFFALNG